MLFRSAQAARLLPAGGQPAVGHVPFASPGTTQLDQRPLVVGDRKSTRLNSSHTEIYTLSLHDALPICAGCPFTACRGPAGGRSRAVREPRHHSAGPASTRRRRSEEHTSELQSHRDLHSFPTRCSSDLRRLPVYCLPGASRRSVTCRSRAQAPLSWTSVHSSS